jgi:hypothetical protein
MDETEVAGFCYPSGAPLLIKVKPHEVVTIKFVQDARY